MKIYFIAIRFRNSEAIKNYITKKLRKIENQVDEEVYVKFSREKEGYKICINVYVKGKQFQFVKTGTSFYDTVNDIVNHMSYQLYNTKDKEISKNKAPSKHHLSKHNIEDVLCKGISDENVVEIKTLMVPVVLTFENVLLFSKPMSLLEALAQMKLYNREFSICYLSDFNKLCIVDNNGAMNIS